jgi:4-azaleucine resistance transporter AzlC
MKDSVTKQAFITSIPVMAGYVVLGMGFGLLLEDAGYGVGWAFLMAVTIYAGTMQYVGVSLLAGAASVLTAALTTFTVQARHLFYSISLIEKYKGMGKYKPYMIFGITDETYSLMSDPYIPVDKKDEPLYRFLVTLFNHCYWITGCVLGNLLGEVLPFSTDGLEFSMTALFVASFTEQWITMHDHVPAITGFVSTLVCLAVFGPERFLIPALLLMTLILTLLRKREEAQA